VKRESWSARFEPLSGEHNADLIATHDAIGREADVYRRQFRVPKR
jgi:hypothetical protein